MKMRNEDRELIETLRQKALDEQTPVAFRDILTVTVMMSYCMLSAESCAHTLGNRQMIEMMVSDFFDHYEECLKKWKERGLPVGDEELEKFAETEEGKRIIEEVMRAS